MTSGEVSATWPTNPEGLIIATGRRVALYHLTADRLAWLYASSIGSEMRARWRLAGQLPALDQFVKTIFDDAYCQFAIVAKNDNTPLGLAQLCGVDFQNGHAHFTLFIISQQWSSGWPLEGAALAIDYIARRFALRYLYFEIPDFNLATLGRSIERFSDPVLIQRGHHYFDGAHHDIHVRRFDLTKWDSDWVRVLTSPRPW